MLRDGMHVATLDCRDVTQEALAELMLGHVLTYDTAKTERPTGEEVLEVQGLRAEAVRDATFSVRKGEILGVAGPTGLGAIHSPEDAVRAGAGGGRTREA